MLAGPWAGKNLLPYSMAAAKTVVADIVFAPILNAEVDGKYDPAFVYQVVRFVHPRGDRR